MKNIFKYLAVMAMSFTLMGLVACGEKEETTTPASYAFQYEGRTLEPGQTVYFYPRETEVTNDWATVHLLLENNSAVDQPTVLKVERVDGPAAFDALSICYGETCKTGVCPWTSDPFTLVPGVNEDMEVKIDYKPSDAAAANGVYKITIGQGVEMKYPQYMLLSMSSQAAE